MKISLNLYCHLVKVDIVERAELFYENQCRLYGEFHTRSFMTFKPGKLESSTTFFLPLKLTFFSYRDTLVIPLALIFVTSVYASVQRIRALF